jgi:hypothetical protein
MAGADSGATASVRNDPGPHAGYFALRNRVHKAEVDARLRLAASLAALLLTGCSGAPANNQAADPPLDLPPAPPTLNGMTLVRGPEALRLIGERELHGLAVSNSVTFLANGVMTFRQDLGISGARPYRIVQDAFCPSYPQEARPEGAGPESHCRRFYRARHGVLFQVFVGHEDRPEPVRFHPDDYVLRPARLGTIPPSAREIVAAQDCGPLPCDGVGACLRKPVAAVRDLQCRLDPVEDLASCAFEMVPAVRSAAERRRLTERVNWRFRRNGPRWCIAL